MKFSPSLYVEGPTSASALCRKLLFINKYNDYFSATSTPLTAKKDVYAVSPLNNNTLSNVTSTRSKTPATQPMQGLFSISLFFYFSDEKISKLRNSNI